MMRGVTAGSHHGEGMKMQSHRVTMLGTGLIGEFYTMTLHGQRNRDSVAVVYSRSEARGAAFAERWSIPHHTTSLAEAITHPETDVVVVDRKSTRLNSSHIPLSRMPSSA